MRYFSIRSFPKDHIFSHGQNGLKPRFSNSKQVLAIEANETDDLQGHFQSRIWPLYHLLTQMQTLGPHPCVLLISSSSGMQTLRIRAKWYHKLIGPFFTCDIHIIGHEVWDVPQMSDFKVCCNSGGLTQVLWHTCKMQYEHHFECCSPRVLRLWKAVHLTLLWGEKAGYETICIYVYIKVICT